MTPMPCAWAASTNRRRSSGVPYRRVGANRSTPSYPQPNRPGHAATRTISLQVTAPAATSGRPPAAAGQGPSVLNVPTAISYRTVPRSVTPFQPASVQRNADGSITTDGPWGPSGWDRDAGSGYGVASPSSRKRYRVSATTLG